jgi:hypothetical protein
LHLKGYTTPKNSDKHIHVSVAVVNPKLEPTLVGILPKDPKTHPKHKWNQHLQPSVQKSTNWNDLQTKYLIPMVVVLCVLRIVGHGLHA